MSFSIAFGRTRSSTNARVLDRRVLDQALLVGAVRSKKAALHAAGALGARASAARPRRLRPDARRARAPAPRRDVDLAPVLDLPDGPLGARQYRSPLYGVAFARGLAAGGAGACVKHFPGLGTLPVSTDAKPYVRGHIRDADLAPYRAAIEAGVPCVMVGHGVYPTLGGRRAVARRRRLAALHDHRLAQLVHGRAAQPRLLVNDPEARDHWRAFDSRRALPALEGDV
jgi:beta-glucosidase-like glycosyl hydrolase